MDADILDIGVAPSSPHPSGAMNGYMFLKDGTRYRFDGGKVSNIRDRNGNFMTFTYGTNTGDVYTFGRIIQILDSSGRSISLTYRNASTDFDSITYLGVNNTSRTVEVHYCSLDPALVSQTCSNYSAPTGGAKTYRDLFFLPGGSSTTKYNPYVVSYVKLPDTRHYEFSYNVYGELTRVKLPTGGSIQYDFGAGDPTLADTTGLIGGANTIQAIYRRVKERRVYLGDGTTLQNTTTYAPTYSSTCNLGEPWCSTIAVTQTDNTAAGQATAPAVANSPIMKGKHYFYGGPNDPNTFFFDGGFYARYLEGREFKVEQYKSDGTTLLSTKFTSWEQRGCVSGESCPATPSSGKFSSPIDIRIHDVSTVNNDATGESVTETYSYDRYNNVTAKTDADATLVRSTNRIFNSTAAYVDLIMSGSSPDVPTTVHIRNSPTEESVSDSSTTVAKTTFEYDNYTPDSTHAAMTSASTTQHDSAITTKRGNVTKQSNWILSSSSTVDTYRQYDLDGNIVKIIDPRGNAIQIEYNSVNYASTFPTKVTNALAQFASSDFDFATGKQKSFTDLNGFITNYSYVDILDRLTSITTPDGGTTTYAYCDSGSTATCPTTPTPPTNSVTKSVKQFSCSQNDFIISDSVYDGLGRTKTSHSYEVPSSASAANTITAETIFDGFGRQYKTSNPYRTETPVYTVTAYDSVGRVLTVTAPDTAAVVTNTYVGRTTTSTDASIANTSDPGAGKTKRISDAFGRLISVTEDPDVSAAAFTTYYRYDALDNLLGVCPGSAFSGSTCSTTRSRSFTYDSLKRLLTAINPESGATTYTYDGNGNLASKTDARSWKTDFGTYDVLNRPVSKTYSNSTGVPASTVAAPSVSWVWDTATNGRGRLFSIASGSTTVQYGSYDSMGRPLTSSQTTTGSNSGNPYSFAYTYSLAGGMETESYPSTRKVTTCYDQAGRTKSVNGKATPSATTTTNYTGTGAISYVPHGAMFSMTRGDTLTETWTYNNRLQPSAITVGTGGSAFGASLYYCPSKAASCTTNNGNLRTATLTVPSVDQNFTYDHLNRLSTAAEGSNWSRNYGYDNYGNRWVSVNSSGGVTLDPFTPVAASNFDTSNRLQIQNSDYDAAGNQKQIGGYAFVSDAENRLVSSTQLGVPTTFGYDGMGKRVTKQVTKPTGSTTTTFVYDAMGRLAADYGSPQMPCVTCYLSADHLGSTRALTDSTGTVVERHDYLPFGEEIYSGVGARTTGLKYFAYNDAPDALAQKFTSKERDAETGLDYFGARYFSAAQGRFTSPDKPFMDQKISQPQSWNLYAYARNNPLRFTDPTGMAVYGDDETLRQYEQHKEWVQNFDQCARGCNSLSAGFKLPSDPSGLGKEWTLDTRHRAPNGTRWTRPDGTSLDFDKGKPGANGFEGEDHWHVKPPGGKKDNYHYRPGTEIELPDQKPEPQSPEPPTTQPEQQKERNIEVLKTGGKVIGGLGAGYLIYRGIRLLPSFFPPLLPTLPANLAIP